MPPNMQALIGGLTPEETADLARAALQALPEETMFKVLEETLIQRQKEELGESWFNIDRKL